MSCWEDSSRSLRQRVAQVEGEYEKLVGILKRKVQTLEEELVCVKGRMKEMKETMHRKTQKQDVRQIRRHATEEPDLNRTILTRMYNFFNQCEQFHGNTPPQVVGATRWTASTSSDSIFSNSSSSSSEESPDRPVEKPPYMNSDFIQKLNAIFLGRVANSVVDPQSAAAQPQHVPHPSFISSSHPRPSPHHHSTSPPRQTRSPLPPPPVPPPPSPPSPPQPCFSSFEASHRKESFPRSSRKFIPPFARHASDSGTPFPRVILDRVKRYCLVTQGSGSGGLHFLNDDRHIHLKTRRQDRVYQFDGVFKSYRDVTAIPRTLKDDIHKLVGGKEVCVVAFGHSYTGKTKLVLGDRKTKSTGLLGVAAKKIIKLCRNLRNTALKISACEVFGGEAQDLLRGHRSKRQGYIGMESGPATWVDLSSQSDVHKITRAIKERRRTRMECWPTSSASHLLLTLSVIQRGVVMGRMVMVDVAGFRTHGTITRCEADRYINFSLKDLAFALSGQMYDQTSLLVQILQDYLTGPGKSVYVYCCLGRWDGQEDANFLSLHYLAN